jgi:hypothetical protein
MSCVLFGTPSSLWAKGHGGPKPEWRLRPMIATMIPAVAMLLCCQGCCSQQAAGARACCRA